ncbi:glycosyltransferase family A protein [Acidipila sp. EB88]|uniref:glycosyltransferase family 2 protein n=1 Tax=Acidipila sp. EB88 TaxID=2305226 RepID=UPI000F5E263A|nr:glycosyltransferase family A protein [Acidipila sp. EB88]RRA47324.1 glycosyltransferase family 2 protein [Acidipila sp. EB88]
MAQDDPARSMLTVGLPVHNAMPYLPESLESLLQQSTDDFQILAVVDGSTDGSLEYLHSIRDARLRVLEQQHCGLTFTLNRMLRACQTPWLVRQDADDLATPDRLARILEAIKEHPDAGMFYSNAAYYPRRRSVGLYRCTRGTPDQIRSVARSGYLPAICHPSATLNVAKTLAVGAYRPGIQCEDADLWWRMALAYDIHFIPDVLLLYRQNANSLTTRNLHEQALHGLYVQYLLLSQLQSRVPETLGQVQDELLALLQKTPLVAKEKLRLFNMHLGEGKPVAALRALLSSFVASPRYVLGRVRDEMLPSGSIANGVEPQLFQQRKDTLWPQHSSV